MPTLTERHPTANAADCGGKAVHLLELQAAGFRVPPFVVSPADLPAAVDRLGTPVAVRSSASVEDGRHASFAGQFRSFLNLHTVEEIDDAIHRCRDSVREPSVVEYCRSNGIEPQTIRMHVIVQQMIEPELSGVAFTVNPVTGAEEVTIEACAGLCDDLLAGRAQPLPPDHPLLEMHREEIEETARAIQRHFGAPQDVEFAIQSGDLYILQARPITRIGFSSEVGEWTNADFRDGGVSSSVCSPLMWSLYEFVWDHALKVTLRELKLFVEDFPAGRMFFGRPYWNLGAVKDCLALLPGFVEREFDEDLSVEINYAGDGRRTPFTPGRILRAIPTLLALRRFFVAQQAAAEQLLDGGFDVVMTRYEQLPDDVEPAFRRLIERDYFQLECTYFRTIFAASLAKLDFLSSFPDADYGSLVAALPPLRHMAPVREVQAMGERSEQSLSAIVGKYRHHCRLGLDVLFPRWDEDSEFVVQMLESLPASGGDNPRVAYEAARAAAFFRVPRWRRRTFDRKLDRLRRFVWLREELRDLSSRMYYVIRRYVLEIAERRLLGDDIFFSTFREIFADDRSHIDHNREIYESYRNFRAPNEIGSRYLSVAATPTAGMTGIAASPGRATGTAHIARNVEEALQMQTGQILVCPFTDPGWTPVLDRAAGVVTETGGLLSHAAIICREYGIPAVLGVIDATTKIHQGMTITLHGGEGRVEIAPHT